MSEPLKKIELLVIRHRAEWGLHNRIELLSWEVVEGDEEGEEHLQIEYLLPDVTPAKANVSRETLITEMLQDYGFDLSSLKPRLFKREDRDAIVDTMYKALGTVKP